MGGGEGDGEGAVSRGRGRSGVDEGWGRGGLGQGIERGRLPRTRARTAHALSGTWYRASIHMYMANQAGGRVANWSW